MLTNAAGLQIIKENEGCKLIAYRDVVGVWTIGFGHTGADVHPGMRITLPYAEMLLRNDLSSFELGVNRLLGDHPVTKNQFSAMVSLTYNIGVGAFGRSTVLRDFLAGNFHGAADAFLLWNRAGGQVYSGLVRRRNQERQLFLTPDSAPQATIVDNNVVPGTQAPVYSIPHPQLAHTAYSISSNPPDNSQAEAEQLNLWELNNQSHD